ncbi:hypothetical protein [Microbacterium sp. CJ77]|uniref:hypothetical protein n=1 Tax=Microbacterium sp. CJ77 TaxID=2079201 RepID=UPI000CD92D76|nr:hypothetical protein [Microbacterium sp. CJ77]
MAVRNAFTALGAGAVMLLALAGCTTAPASPGSSSSVPTGGEVSEVEVDATWLDDGRMIGIITYGSSTCIPVVEDAALQDNGTFAVILADPDEDTVCTADMVPRVALVEALPDMDPAVDLEITVAGDGYTGDTELDAVQGLDPSNTASEYAPSAGWIDTDDSFVIVTWGSSTCVPVVESTAVSGAAEVTVTFVDPPADQVCTMDMVPRALITSVSGLGDDSDGDSGITAVLVGDDFDNVRVPIYGSN